MAYWGTQRVQCEYCLRFQALTVRRDRRIIHVPHGNRPPGGVGLAPASQAPKRHKLWYALKVLEQAGIDVSHVTIPPEEDADDPS